MYIFVKIMNIIISKANCSYHKGCNVAEYSKFIKSYIYKFMYLFIYRHKIKKVYWDPDPI